MVDWYPINSSQWIINCYVYTYLYIYIYIVIIYIFILYAYIYIYSVCYTNILCMFMYYIYIYIYIISHITTRLYPPWKSDHCLWGFTLQAAPPTIRVDSKLIHDLFMIHQQTKTNIYFCNRANLSHLLLGSVTWRGCWIPNKSRRKKTPIVPMTFNC